MAVHLLGIRHHGPGSSRRLERALTTLQPDCILIEGPAELDTLIKYCIDKELQPPVAALLYNPKNLKEVVYYPYAAFSPEWITYQFALKHQTEIRNIDLPQALRLGLQAMGATDKIQPHLFEKEKADEELVKIAKDPLGYMAQLAGYEDTERWWELTFELTDDDTTVFSGDIRPDDGAPCRAKSNR